MNGATSTAVDAPALVNAVRIWVGWGHSARPSRDEQRLADKIGGAEAQRLLPLIHQLETDFYRSDAGRVAADLTDMSALIHHFQQLHPDLPAEIATLLAWCYTYDHR